MAEPVRLYAELYWKSLTASSNGSSPELEGGGSGVTAQTKARDLLLSLIPQVSQRYGCNASGHQSVSMPPLYTHQSNELGYVKISDYWTEGRTIAVQSDGYVIFQTQTYKTSKSYAPEAIASSQNGLCNANGLCVNDRVVIVQRPRKNDMDGQEGRIKGIFTTGDLLVRTSEYLGKIVAGDVAKIPQSTSPAQPNQPVKPRGNRLLKVGPCVESYLGTMGGKSIFQAQFSLVRSVAGTLKTEVIKGDVAETLESTALRFCDNRRDPIVLECQATKGCEIQDAW